MGTEKPAGRLVVQSVIQNQKTRIIEIRNPVTFHVKKVINGF